MYVLLVDVPMMRRKAMTFVTDADGEVLFSAASTAAAIRWIMEKGATEALWVDEIGEVLLQFHRAPE